MIEQSRYKAPALTKGLEILEYLAQTGGELNAREISTGLKRSVGEIYRVLQVLEELGYISRGESGFSLTNRLLALSMGRPVIRDLITVAVPIMHNLACKSGQSCHLVVASSMEMVVIAGVEARGLIGFAVRVGYRRPLHRSASGRVLLAFQSAEGRREMIDEIREGGELIDDHTLAIELDTIARDGGCVAPSPVITGITDLSAPVRIAGQARAALTVPFVHGHDAHVDLASLRAAVWSAAMRIANQLVPPA